MVVIETNCSLYTKSSLSDILWEQGFTLLQYQQYLVFFLSGITVLLRKNPYADLDVRQN